MQNSYFSRIKNMFSPNLCLSNDAEYIHFNFILMQN